MKKVKSLILFIFIFYSNFAYANNEDFNNWLNDFKKIAIKNNIVVKLKYNAFKSSNFPLLSAASL